MLEKNVWRHDFTASDDIVEETEQMEATTARWKWSFLIEALFDNTWTRNSVHIIGSGPAECGTPSWSGRKGTALPGKCSSSYCSIIYGVWLHLPLRVACCAVLILLVWSFLFFFVVLEIKPGPMHRRQVFYHWATPVTNLVFFLHILNNQRFILTVDFWNLWICFLLTWRQLLFHLKDAFMTSLWHMYPKLHYACTLGTLISKIRVPGPWTLRSQDSQSDNRYSSWLMGW